MTTADTPPDTTASWRGVALDALSGFPLSESQRGDDAAAEVARNRSNAFAAIATTIALYDPHPECLTRALDALRSFRRALAARTSVDREYTLAPGVALTMGGVLVRFALSGPPREVAAQIGGPMAARLDFARKVDELRAAAVDGRKPAPDYMLRGQRAGAVARVQAWQPALSRPEAV